MSSGPLRRLSKEEQEVIQGLSMKALSLVLLDIEEMEAAVTHLQTEPSGVLKISAPPVIGATHITRAVVEFLKGRVVMHCF